MKTAQKSVASFTSFLGHREYATFVSDIAAEVVRATQASSDTRRRCVQPVLPLAAGGTQIRIIQKLDINSGGAFWNKIVDAKFLCRCLLLVGHTRFERARSFNRTPGHMKFIIVPHLVLDTVN